MTKNYNVLKVYFLIIRLTVCLLKYAILIFSPGKNDKSEIKGKLNILNWT